MTQLQRKTQEPVQNRTFPWHETNPICAYLHSCSSQLKANGLFGTSCRQCNHVVATATAWNQAAFACEWVSEWVSESVNERVSEHVCVFECVWECVREHEFIWKNFLKTPKGNHQYACSSCHVVYNWGNWFPPGWGGNQVMVWIVGGGAPAAKYYKLNYKQMIINLYTCTHPAPQITEIFCCIRHFSATQSQKYFTLTIQTLQRF
jgi:hypothetical protein